MIYKNIYKLSLRKQLFMSFKKREKNIMRQSLYAPDCTWASSCEHHVLLYGGATAVIQM